ncbi:MAG TPA: DNA-formamidopyrimidine glycosylase family protein [Candidatus Limnocylindrales bacterium]
MPEGDTLFRTAAGLRPYLVGRAVLAARATRGAQVGRLVGATVESVDTIGKNLLIRCSNGLEVRTHLRMNGTWHRYRPGERWRRPAARAVLVLEVEGAVAVCFDAPVVELFDARAEVLHPALAPLGPDLLDQAFDPVEALRRLRHPARSATTIGEALLDQRVMAGVGNVYRSEILFIERVDPLATVASLDEATLERLINTARRLLLANADRRRGPERTTTEGAREAGGAPLWVYGRASRPCRRCGTPVASASLGRDLPRTVWSCPSCQGADGEGRSHS